MCTRFSWEHVCNPLDCSVIHFEKEITNISQYFKSPQATSMLLPVATYLPGSVCNHSIYDAIVTVSIYTDAYNYINNHQTPQMNTPHWRFCTMHTTTRCSSCLIVYPHVQLQVQSGTECHTKSNIYTERHVCNSNCCSALSFRMYVCVCTSSVTHLNSCLHCSPI